METGLDLCTGMTAANFNFARYSRLLLGATAGKSSSVNVSHSLYKLLLTGATELARTLARHVDGHGSDNHFFYTLTEYSALLIQLLKRYGRDEITATAIIKEAIEPIQNSLVGHSTSLSRPNDVVLLVNEAVLHKRLCEYVTELGDVADLVCGFHTQATWRLSKRFELLHLMKTASELILTVTMAELSSRTCGARLHLTLLSLTKMCTHRFVLRELRKQQLR